MSENTQKECLHRTSIGGQAVMEGVMMQSPANESMAIAVRKPDGKIVVTCEHREPVTRKHKWMGKPIIRGCVNMVAMLKMGMQTLDKSTQMLGMLEEEPTKFEKWLKKHFGVPGQTGTVAGDIDHPIGRHVADGLDGGFVQTLSGRIHHDDLGLIAFGGHFGGGLSCVGAQEPGVFDAVAGGKLGDDLKIQLFLGLGKQHRQAKALGE